MSRAFALCGVILLCLVIWLNLGCPSQVQLAGSCHKLTGNITVLDGSDKEPTSLWLDANDFTIKPCSSYEVTGERQPHTGSKAGRLPILLRLRTTRETAEELKDFTSASQVTLHSPRPIEVSVHTRSSMSLTVTKEERQAGLLFTLRDPSEEDRTVFVGLPITQFTSQDFTIWVDDVPVGGKLGWGQEAVEVTMSLDEANRIPDSETTPWAGVDITSLDPTLAQLVGGKNAQGFFTIYRFGGYLESGWPWKREQPVTADPLTTLFSRDPTLTFLDSSVTVGGVDASIWLPTMALPLPSHWDHLPPLVQILIGILIGMALSAVAFPIFR